MISPILKRKYYLRFLIKGLKIGYLITFLFRLKSQQIPDVVSYNGASTSLLKHF